MRNFKVCPEWKVISWCLFCLRLQRMYCFTFCLTLAVKSFSLWNCFRPLRWLSESSRVKSSIISVRTNGFPKKGNKGKRKRLSSHVIPGFKSEGLFSSVGKSSWQQQASSVLIHGASQPLSLSDSGKKSSEATNRAKVHHCDAFHLEAGSSSFWSNVSSFSPPTR